jgi:hypothetical protein
MGWLLIVAEKMIREKRKETETRKWIRILSHMQPEQNNDIMVTTRTF